MSHVYHDALPGFDPRNILHDGCPECEARAADPLRVGLPGLDENNRLMIWQRMRVFQFADSGHTLANEVGDFMSDCDRKLTQALYYVAIFMQRAGISPEEIETRLIGQRKDLLTRLNELSS